MAVVRPRSIVYLYKTSSGSRSLINSVALNAALGSRTLTLQTSPRDSESVLEFVTIGVRFTYSAATEIFADTYGSLDNGATYQKLQASSVAVGVDTLFDYIVRKQTSSASQNYSFTLQVDNHTHIKLEFRGTGAGAGDLITVQANGGCK